MSNIVTPQVPVNWANEEDHRRKIANAVNQILKGKTNNTGTVTLTANAATTTLSDPRIGIYSVVFLQPTTANAAAALTGVYFNSPGDGSVVINHANNAQTDRTFSFSVTG